jgi:hypothetical protein
MMLPLNTTIVDGVGRKEEIQGRVAQIRAQIEETTSDYDREKLQERLANGNPGRCLSRRLARHHGSHGGGEAEEGSTNAHNAGRRHGLLTHTNWPVPAWQAGTASPSTVTMGVLL